MRFEEVKQKINQIVGVPCECVRVSRTDVEAGMCAYSISRDEILLFLTSATLTNCAGGVSSYYPNEYVCFKPDINVQRHLVRLFSLSIDCYGTSGVYSNTLLELTSNVITNNFEVALTAPTCDVCNSPSWDLYNTADGKKVCRHCYNELYVRCQRCGSTVQRTTAEITRDNYALCPECAKRRTVLPYHRYYPKIQFFGNDHAKTVPMMGFELEIDDGGEDNRNAGIVVDILNSNALFGYCSHDGSLHDGFEIITQPATLEYHNSIKNVYNELCSKMKSLGYSSHDTTTCGFHVHVNRDFFGDSRENQNAAIRRLVFITEKFWNELVIYARRPEKRMERYAKKIAPMEITEYMRRANQSHDHNFHYYALNIANEDTVEFRMFKGTLNVNTILATLQLVNNLCIVAKNNTLDEIRQMHFEDFVTSRVQKSYWKRRIGLPDTEE
jgi:DNA-directed RNA polymerase subunit RPC12/RpoP